jgi:hypothetical protein
MELTSESLTTMMQTISGLDVPMALAVSMLTHGYTESEARQIMIEGGIAREADVWIAQLRDLGCFVAALDEHATQNAASPTIEAISFVDGGTFLWKFLKKELSEDESGFKHRMCVLNNAIKEWDDRTFDLLSTQKARSFIPFSVIADNCPWHGCKFASSVVLHLLSKVDSTSKRMAVQSVCRSLGGCTIPSVTELAAIRWPYV